MKKDPLEELMGKGTQQESSQGGFVNIVRKGINKVVKVRDHYQIDHRLDHLTPIERFQYYLSQGAIDLHMHTNASDGFDSPPQLLEKVMKAKLKTFAITDHDTLWGVEDLYIVIDKLSQLGMKLPELIPGIELSLDFNGEEVHLLAYFPSGGEMQMKPFLEEAKHQRDLRNRLLCERLTELGMPVSLEELNRQGGQVINRVHVATLLMRKGYCASVQDAFDQWIGEGCPAYLPAEYAPVEEGIQRVHDCGGVAVIAHPKVYGWLSHQENCLEERLLELQAMGLDGVEVIHGETTQEEAEEIAVVAKRLGLIRTIGSDYHGVNKLGVKLFGEEAYQADLLIG